MPLLYEQLKVLSNIIMSNSDCDLIVASLNVNLEYKQQYEHRSVLIKSINLEIVKNLKKTIVSANENYFKFNLNYNHVDCFFARYETGMHYQQLHMDCVAGTQQRKLSFSLLLNDNFQGGEFKLLQNSSIELTKGKLLVFPSFLPHAVTPVVSGVRYVIFGWFYGPQFV